ncbi:MAG: hypothetical protein HY720_06175 [Planctomycetes bacterium]|nr:hypothetical protein [Planctomycetota bacterium]
MTVLREPATGEAPGVTLALQDGKTREATFEQLPQVLTVFSAPVDGSPVVQA